MREKVTYIGQRAAHSPMRFNPKRLVVMMAIIVIIFSVVFLYLMGDFGTGYKFTVSGKVRVGGVGDGKWYIENVKVSDPERDWNVLAFPDLSVFDTGGIVVKCSVGGSDMEKNIGTVPKLGGEQRFSMEFRHIDPGSYTGQIEAYEEMCQFGFWDCQLEYKDFESFNVNVVGE